MIIAIGEVLWDLLPGQQQAGGAPLNFAYHCQRLGHSVFLVSRVGRDELGTELLDEMNRMGLSTEFIQIDPDHPTGTVTVSLNAAGVPDYTIDQPVAWDFIEWDERLEHLVEPKSIYFGSLAQRNEISRSTIRRLVDRHPRSRRFCDLNLRAPDYDSETIDWCLYNSLWFKVNESEFEILTNDRPDWDKDVAARARQFRQTLHFKLFCLTRGEAGAIAISDSSGFRIPGISSHVVDTVGAGDAFSAAMATQLLDRKKLEEAATFANAYAALIASKQGATPEVSDEELNDVLDRSRNELAARTSWLE
jgi:fructokinase